MDHSKKSREQLIQELEELHDLVGRESVGTGTTGLLRHVLENSRDLAYSLNLETGSYDYMSPLTEGVLGLSLDEFLALGIEEIASRFHPDDQKQYEDHFNDITVRKGEIDSVIEYRWKHGDGTYHWYSDNRNLILDDSGAPVAITGNVRDITTRMEAEEALRKSEERFRTIYENAPVLINSFDGQGRCVLWNRQCEEKFGWTLEELNAHENVLSLFYPDPEVCREVTRSIIEEPEGRFLEWHPVTRDGRILTTKWANFRLPDGTAISLGYDITGQKEAEAENQMLQAQLQQAQKMEAIGRLAGGVAHDFNNLLTGIMGYASLIGLDLVEGDRSLSSTREILSICRRAQDLTTNLLGFAREGKFRKQTIDIGRSIQEVRGFLGQTISKMIIVKVRVEEDLPPVEGDEGQISQILMNLCINAADAMGEAGTLGIEARQGEGRQVQITVSDTGTGMEPVVVSRAFEPFFTTKPRGEGTGLGLSMVYGAVKNHGGTVNIDSEPGRGTTVAILLPALEKVEPREQDKSNDQPAQEVMATGRGTILLVDDEEMVRSSTSRLLQRLGYEVVQASNGMEAVEIFSDQANSISVVILDMAMPIMGGAEAFRRLKQMVPDVRVVIFSGFSADAKIDRLMEDGALDFIQKPFLPERLAAVVARAMAG